MSHKTKRLSYAEGMCTLQHFSDVETDNVHSSTVRDSSTDAPFLPTAAVFEETGELA